MFIIRLFQTEQLFWLRQSCLNAALPIFYLILRCFSRKNAANMLRGRSLTSAGISAADIGHVQKMYRYSLNSPLKSLVI